MPWQTESIRSNLFQNFQFYLIFSYLKLPVPWVFLNIICRISMYKDLLNREINKYMYIIFQQPILIFNCKVQSSEKCVAIFI